MVLCSFWGSKLVTVLDCLYSSMMFLFFPLSSLSYWRFTGTAVSLCWLQRLLSIFPYIGIQFPLLQESIGSLLALRGSCQNEEPPGRRFRGQERWGKCCLFKTFVISVQDACRRLSSPLCLVHKDSCLYVVRKSVMLGGGIGGGWGTADFLCVGT